MEAAERERKEEERNRKNRVKERKMGVGRKREKDRGVGRGRDSEGWCCCHGNRRHLGEEQNRTAQGKDPVCTHTCTKLIKQSHIHLCLIDTALFLDILVEYENFFSVQSEWCPHWPLMFNWYAWARAMSYRCLLPPCLASNNCAFVQYTNSEPDSVSYGSYLYSNLHYFTLRSCIFQKHQLRLTSVQCHALEKPLCAYCMPYCTHS